MIFRPFGAKKIKKNWIWKMIDILSFLKDDCYEIETSKSSIRFMRLSGNQQMMNTSNIDKRIKLRYLKWLFVVEKYDLMITFKKKLSERSRILQNIE